MLSTDIGKVTGVKSQHRLNCDIAVFDDGAQDSVHKAQATTLADGRLNGAVACVSILRVIE